VTLSAKWTNPRKLETNAIKDGKDAGVVTYEVSSDGKTLTSRYSTAPEQVLVFDRQ
jgi:predicted MarR family transcription regulator